jgi:lysyl-tRNA synthetase class 2
MPDSRWFSPTRHADRRPLLLARNRIIAAIRAWFAEQDFLEVDCAALALSPGNEAHLHGFSTELIQPDGSTERRYLHSSPEFACKKLLAAGEARILNLCHVWRYSERTLTHSPEFTMLEWYRAHEDYETIIADTLALVRLAAEVAGTKSFRWRGREADPLAEAQWLTVNDAFIRFAGVVHPQSVRDNTVLSSQVADARIEYRGAGVTDEVQRPGWISRLFMKYGPN